MNWIGLAISIAAALVFFWGLARWLASHRSKDLQKVERRYDGLTASPAASRILHGTLDGLEVEVTIKEDPDDHHGGRTQITARLPESAPDDLAVAPASDAPDRAAVYRTDDRLNDDYAVWRRNGDLPELDLQEAFDTLTVPMTSDISLKDGRLTCTLATGMVPIPILVELLDATVSMAHTLADTR